MSQEETTQTLMAAFYYANPALTPRRARWTTSSAQRRRAWPGPSTRALVARGLKLDPSDLAIAGRGEITVTPDDVPVISAITVTHVRSNAAPEGHEKI